MTLWFAYTFACLAGYITGSITFFVTVVNCHSDKGILLGLALCALSVIVTVVGLTVLFFAWYPELYAGLPRV
jgi:hypothetical protein